MRIGIRDGCLRLPWTAAFQVAADIGFDGVELDIGADYRETPLWGKDGVAVVAGMAKASSCSLLAFCAGACWALSPASRDEEVRTEISNLLEQLIGFAASLGARTILVPVTPGGDDMTDDEGAERWIDQMKAIAPKAEAHGVVLALENVGRGYGKSAQDLISLVDGVSSPAVKTYYDIGNAVAFGNDPVEEIRQLGERIAAVHIKDREGELLGEGVVEIEDSVAALKAVGYEGDLILETPPTDNPRAAAAHNLAYMRALL